MIRTMDDQETAYDYKRYKQLLVEAVDETKRLELIEILIRESARDRLEAQRMSDRAAITAVTVAKVLGSNGRGIH
jgi:ABC-type oligopeptide transport system substrate-binding subunit